MVRALEGCEGGRGGHARSRLRPDANLAPWLPDTHDRGARRPHRHASHRDAQSAERLMAHDLAPGARIVVAMSGGVDSSVTAALLAEEGYEVIGVTLQLYDHGEARGRAGACCAGQDVRDAARLSERLGIPHYVLDC